MEHVIILENFRSIFLIAARIKEETCFLTVNDAMTLLLGSGVDRVVINTDGRDELIFLSPEKKLMFELKYL